MVEGGPQVVWNWNCVLVWMSHMPHQTSVNLHGENCCGVMVVQERYPTSSGTNIAPEDVLLGKEVGRE